MRRALMMNASAAYRRLGGAGRLGMDTGRYGMQRRIFANCVLAAATAVSGAFSHALADADFSGLHDADGTYYNGSRYVGLYADDGALDVVMVNDEIALPAAIGDYLIDRYGRHAVVRPPDAAVARAQYLAMTEVSAVQRVFYLSSSGRAAAAPYDRLALSRRVAVRTAPGQNLAGLLAEFDVQSIEQPPYDAGIHIVSFNHDEALEASLSLMQSGVVFAVPQFDRLARLRHTPDDPMFGVQWHLQNIGQAGALPGADISAPEAWDVSRGAGVLIGIVDDGLDWGHPDLFANYDAVASYDFNGGDPNPVARCSDAHGTSMAGIAAAIGDNEIGVSGVAPQASVAALRLVSGPFSDEDVAAALSYMPADIQIYNNSWGPDDDGRTIDGPGPLAQAAIENGIAGGRGGRGSIFVWAAGNGGATDDANFDGYANSRYTIAVGASSNSGTLPGYSEPGACILINAPSSGGTIGIVTTDAAGICGSDPGDYYIDAGGTSAATAIVSGVAALMLDVNPTLTWRDVRHILVRSATTNDSSDPGWAVNAAGFPIHPYYGMGRVNAAAAVNLAGNWANVGPELCYASSVVAVNKTIPDNRTTGLASTLSVPARLALEQVEVHIVLAHPRRGDLVIKLTSPRGTLSTLAARRAADLGQDIVWTFTTVRNWGEYSNGTWRLNVADLAAGEVGTLQSWNLRVYGTAVPAKKGDMNEDGLVDLQDVPDFSLALSDPSAYHTKHPGIDLAVTGDVNGDGTMNILDIDPFCHVLEAP